MDDLFDDVPEWTTTIISVSNIGGNGVTKHLQGMHLLKGYKYTEALAGFFRWPDGSMLAAPEEQSPKISIRGVRSATPRFVKVR